MHENLQEWHRLGRDDFTHNGHPVFWHEAGQGEALLLIHGFPTASWDWQKLFPDLSSRYRVIVVDLLGYGFSAKPRDYEYRVSDHADQCEALLAHLKIEAYHILAHDYGDTVTQELLARQLDDRGRQRIESVALLNGGLFPEVHRRALIQSLLLSPIGPLVARLTSKRRFAANMRRICGPQTQPSPAEIDGFWELMQYNNGLRIMPALIRYIRERVAHRSRWCRALSDTRMPLHFINGLLDPISGEHMVLRFRELVPGAGVTVLPEQGHYPQVENPEAVLAAYAGFRRG